MNDMDSSYSRKHGARGVPSVPLKPVMPSVETEGLRQTRDCCPTATKKLQAYFERGEKDTQRMDRWTQIHLEHCSTCSDFFHMLIDPDFEERR
jgi:hypothetical protein